MSKLKTVKEVRELTGLNRKQLFDYKEIVKPAAYANLGYEGNDGYKLYDDEGVDKLQQIALFIELDVKKEKIKEIMMDPNYDRNKILDEQLAMAKEKIKHLQNLVTVVEQLKQMGIKYMSMGDFISGNLDEWAELMRKRLNSEEYKEIIQHIDQMTKEQNEEFRELLCDLAAMEGKYEIDDEKVKEHIDKIRLFYSQTMHLEEPRYVYSAGISYINGGESAKEVNKWVGRDAAEFIGAAYINYIFEELDEKCEELSDPFNSFQLGKIKKVENKGVQKWLDKIRNLVDDYIGINDWKVFYEFVEEYITFTGEEDKYPETRAYNQYVLTATKYYCEHNELREMFERR